MKGFECANRYVFGLSNTLIVDISKGSINKRVVHKVCWNWKSNFPQPKSALCEKKDCVRQTDLLKSNFFTILHAILMHLIGEITIHVELLYQK